MAKNDAVEYRDYHIYPLALYLQPQDKWQPMAIITRDMRDESVTLPRSQSFTEMPGLFDTEEEALTYALNYARMLVDGKQEGLTI